MRKFRWTFSCFDNGLPTIDEIFIWLDARPEIQWVPNVDYRKYRQIDEEWEPSVVSKEQPLIKQSEFDGSIEITELNSDTIRSGCHSTGKLKLYNGIGVVIEEWVMRDIAISPENVHWTVNYKSIFYTSYAPGAFRFGVKPRLINT